MQPLKNARQEKFAQIVALGSSQASAYKAAGYGGKDAAPKGARLASFGKVRARIEWLQRQAAERVEVTLESLIADAQRCRDLGILHGQINASVLAVKELGILTGFRVERRETRRIDPATISDEELAAIILEGRVERAIEKPVEKLEPPVQPADDDGRNAGIKQNGEGKTRAITRR